MPQERSSSNALRLLAKVHGTLISRRRATRMVTHLASLFECESSILDVGCGNGLVSHLLTTAREDLSVTGLDIVVHDDCLIPARPYDGNVLPNADASVDYVMLTDVLHHTEDPLVLLAEAKRVAGKGIILKDHRVKGLFAWSILCFLDWAGNRPYDTVLTYNYFTDEQWGFAFNRLGMREEVRITKLGLYPFPFGLAFDRELHFISKLVESANRVGRQT